MIIFSQREVSFRRHDLLALNRDMHFLDDGVNVERNHDRLFSLQFGLAFALVVAHCHDRLLVRITEIFIEGVFRRLLVGF